MARRPCIVCGQPCSGSRCPRHPSPGRDPQHRAANYGAAHQRIRAQLEGTLPTPCLYADTDPNCAGIVTSDERWVAAHIVDGDPTSPRAVAHPACNERAKVR